GPAAPPALPGFVLQCSSCKNTQRPGDLELVRTTGGNSSCRPGHIRLDPSAAKDTSVAPPAGRKGSGAEAWYTYMDTSTWSDNETKGIRLDGTDFRTKRPHTHRSVW